MMRTHRLLVASGVAVAVIGLLSAFMPQASLKTGAKAPDFKGEATDGKAHSLASLTKNGPVHLYFIKDGCPVNHRAAPFYKKLDEAYKGKGNLVGVFNGSVKQAREWAKTYKTSFKIIADPDQKIIGNYKAQSSPWAVSVSKDRKIAKVHTDGSEKEMKSLSADIAKGMGAKVATISFTGAPEGGG